MVDTIVESLQVKTDGNQVSLVGGCPLSSQGTPNTNFGAGIAWRGLVPWIQVLVVLHPHVYDVPSAETPKTVSNRRQGDWPFHVRLLGGLAWLGVVRRPGSPGKVSLQLSTLVKAHSFLHALS